MLDESGHSYRPGLIIRLTTHTCDGIRSRAFPEGPKSRLRVGLHGVARWPEAQPLDVVHLPQLRGLGRTETANFYGIASKAEGEAYLAHPVLGDRLKECTAFVNAVEGRSAEEIFGFPDVLKFRSSMTLFMRVSTADSVFEQALKKYYGGEPDAATLKLLGA